jgi:hypothetical protein
VKRTYQITDAISDPKLLGAALGDGVSWQNWRAVLKAAFGLELNDQEAEAFAAVAGSRSPPVQRVRELWAIVGRRGGKSRIAAALAVYLAAFTKPKLSIGEVGMVLVLAASRDQAGTVFSYIKGFLDASPILRMEIANQTAHEITLSNGIVIVVHSNSFRTIRGRTLIACIFDEIAFWRDESSATPDTEVYRAVLPALATTNGMLIGISSAYRKLGLLYQKHRDHFGIDGDEVLVVQGGTRQFNAWPPSGIAAATSPCLLSRLLRRQRRYRTRRLHSRNRPHGSRALCARRRARHPTGAEVRSATGHARIRRTAEAVSHLGRHR